VKCHDAEDCTDLDEALWTEIEDLRNYLARDAIEKKCLLTRVKHALREEAYDEASALQIEMQEETKLLRETYLEYVRNIL
jgi:glutamine synthetase